MASNEQRDRTDQTVKRDKPGGAPPDAGKSQTQQPRPTWGEQTPDLDQQRNIGGGGTSSDSDGQSQ